MGTWACLQACLLPPACQQTDGRVHSMVHSTYSRCSIKVVKLMIGMMALPPHQLQSPLPSPHQGTVEHEIRFWKERIGECGLAEAQEGPLRQRFVRDVRQRGPRHTDSETEVGEGRPALSALAPSLPPVQLWTLARPVWYDLPSVKH